MLQFVAAISLASLAYPQNLIENSSFEDILNCPADSADEVNIAIPWITLFYGGADCYNECSEIPRNGVPDNNFGNQAARTGTGYAGFYAMQPRFGSDINIDYREHIQIELSRPLSKGKLYLVFFYVSLGDDALLSSIAVDNLGLYFSKEKVLSDSIKAFYIQPQIINPSGLFLADKTNWVKITGEYIAKGEEKYVTIGNFFNDEATNKLVLNTETESSYYYIDDVAVYDCAKLVDFQDTLEICSNGDLLLDAFTINAQYKWSTGSQSKSILVQDPGTYWVDVWVDNCYSRDSTFVQISGNQMNTFLGEDTTLCENQNLLLKVSNLDSPYSWQDGSSDSLLYVTKSGLYWVKAFKNGCEVIDSINIYFQPEPKLALGNDTILCNGDVLHLDVSLQSEAQYLWSNHSTDSRLSVSESGLYWVKIMTDNCYVTDSIVVGVFDCLDNIPNVITPNNDGKNDQFQIPGILKDNWKLVIYNRWGKPVFTSYAYKNDWQPNDYSSGIYYYNLKNLATNEKHKGIINVIK